MDKTNFIARTGDDVNAIYEWEFPEPSCDVDIERVCLEVGSIPSIAAQAYMGSLKIKAPIVFCRLKEFAKKNNIMTWYKWS